MTRQYAGAAAAPSAVWKTRLAVVLGGVAVIAACLLIRYFWGVDTANADPFRQTPAAGRPVGPAAGLASPAAATGSSAAKTPAAKGQPPSGEAAAAKVVGMVNGEKITREQLAQDCLRHYGKDVLENMVNKHLISQECKRRGIVISRAEVDAEIQRMAQRFSLPVDQWLKLLKQERGISAAQYASDIIWPTLALRKLAGEKLKVSPQELREAFDTYYGPAVRARMIACKDPRTAEKVRQQAAAKPDEFGNLAKQFSEDASASFKGLIQPIRRHTGCKEIEQAAFTMQDGEVSPVIRVAGQFVILKREVLLPGTKAATYEQLAPQLEEIVRERKLRSVAGDLFQQLQKDARVENVLNDPAKSRAMPGVAALINGQQIPLRDLAEECVQAHGETVLAGAIHRKVIEQACKKHNVTVTKEDIDREVGRAAATLLPPKQDGSPDVDGWLKRVTEEQGISEDLYRSDSVWPTVALKKLVGDDVKITEDDLKKGFEANYGARVRCRAIVLNNFRRAQEVWDLARRKPTVENFGNLAEQYSIEPGSQALRGEVPPIAKNGGQPTLEKEAFSLRPGDLSGIIQVGDKFIILLCEGHTKPVDVSYQEVREEIRNDLHEKKLRLAMAEYFDRLKESATVDNFLAGNSPSPKDKRVAGGPASTPGSVPALRQVSPEERAARSGAALAPKRPGSTTLR